MKEETFYGREKKWAEIQSRITEEKKNVFNVDCRMNNLCLTRQLKKQRQEINEHDMS